MAMKNNTQYAILGILSILPGSGYDIKKYCDTVISNVWHENYGHIYPVLNSLLADGLIIRKDIDESSRRKEYEITREGREEFMKWLGEPSHYAPVRSEFMLKFLFSHNLPRENILEMIREYRARHEAKYENLLRTDKELENQNPNISIERKRYLRATLRYGILSSEAAIKWCEEVSEMFADEQCLLQDKMLDIIN